VLVASPSSRQSGEFLSKASGLLVRAGIRARGDGYNELSLKLPNGSRIVGLPVVEGWPRHQCFDRVVAGTSPDRLWFR
jgi:hypothetical protein